MTGTSDSKNPSSASFATLWILAIAVIAAMGDLMLGIKSAARGFEPIYVKAFGLPVVAFVFVLTVSALLLMWLCVGWPLVRWGGLERFPTFASGVVFLAMVTSYAGSTDPFRTQNIGGTIADVGLICILGLVPAFIAYRLLATRTSQWRRALTRWLARLALAVTAGATIFWAIRYLPSSGSSGLWWALVGVALVALAVGAKVLAHRATWMLALIASVIVAGPFLPWPDSSLRLSDKGPSKPGGKVLLLTIDTLRADALTPYGAPPDSTPHLQRLAEDSVVFEDAISPGNWTLPGAASLLTGLSVSVHEVRRLHNPLPNNIDTLAEWFDRAGFVTAAIGGNPHLSSPVMQFEQGFDRFYFLPMNYGGSFGGKVYDWLRHTERSSGPSTRWLTDQAIDWLRANRDQDFFLWLHYFDPHLGYRPPEQYFPKGERPKRLNDVTAHDLWRIRAGDFTPRARERDWIKALYAGEVSYIDSAVGEILNELRELGVYDETVIAVSSDHGEELFDHDGFEHGHALYEEVIAVPLIVKGAGSNLPAGRRIAQAVGTESIVPTLLELAGIPFDPQRFSAAELVTLAKAERIGGVEVVGTDAAQSDTAAPSAVAEASADEPIIVSEGGLFFEPRLAVRMGRYKYIVGLIDGVEELYDLETDPEERYSLIRERPDLVDAVRAELASHTEHSKRLQDALDIDVGEVEMSGETRRQLESLGYM